MVFPLKIEFLIKTVKVNLKNSIYNKFVQPLINQVIKNKVLKFIKSQMNKNNKITLNYYKKIFKKHIIL